MFVTLTKWLKVVFHGTASIATMFSYSASMEIVEMYSLGCNFIQVTIISPGGWVRVSRDFGGIIE